MELVDTAHPVGGTLDEAARPATREAVLAKYRELLASLGGYQASVRESYGAQIKCGAGCFQCCKTRLAVFPLEAEEVRLGVKRLPADRRRALRARVESDHGSAVDYCAFLVEGACSIYEHRPLLCRIHGLPNTSATYPQGTVEFCELNFDGFDVEAIAAEAILDWDHLGHLLALLNFKFVDIQGREELGRLRIPLAELARQALGLPVDRPAPAEAAS